MKRYCILAFLILFAYGCSSAPKQEPVYSPEPEWTFAPPQQRPAPVQQQQPQPVVVQQPLEPLVIQQPLPPSPHIEIGSLFFAQNISSLGPNARRYLTENAAILKKSNYNRIIITAFAETTEKNPAALADARAKNAAEFLVSQGIPAGKISYKGVITAPQKGNAGRRTDFKVI